MAAPSSDLEQPMRTLMVFVPPAGDKVSRWEGVIAKLKSLSEPNGFDWLIYSPNVKRSIAEAALDLKARIDQHWTIEGAYGQIVLIGISLGGFVIRLAYMQSLGTYPDIPRTTDWAERVVRIVLVGSPSRGIGLDAVGAVFRALMRPALSLFPATRYLKDLLTGSDLITDLKIRWIKHFCGPDCPLVVQMLPAISDLSTMRCSMVDIAQFPGARYIDIPGVTQLQMQDPERYLRDSGVFGQFRWAIFGEAPVERVQRRSTVERVVFVLHGIRASNTGWVSQISRLLKSPNTEVVVASYGYYSLLRFPFALARRRNVRWFQDLYSYNVARHPRAEFYFVGHSYGTYILGQSLSRVPAIRFKRVVLVGSVLPRGYRWSDRIDGGQVVEIRNDRSMRDIPVKVICSALHAFGGDVGTAGVDGFDDGRCLEVFYYPGDHSRPLESENLPDLAAYLLTGTFAAPPELAEGISPILGLVARMSPALAILIVAAVLSIVPGIGWLWITHGWKAALSAAFGVIVVGVLLDAA